METTLLSRELAIHTAEDIITFALNENPSSIQFVLCYRNISSIALYLATKKYIDISLVFGHQFSLMVLKYYEILEDYETCAKMVSDFEAHNKQFPDYKLK